ncbi:MAG: hypothetical protein ACK5SX_16155 [Sandaracinobacter sp.]
MRIMRSVGGGRIWALAFRVLLPTLVLTEGGMALAAAPAPLSGMTPKEARADGVWALRSGLNVAALQCQFSPFLATVPTYNALLRQHSDEMSEAFKTVTNYFVRTKGKAGQRAFDSYATRSNQSWASYDGKVSFCQAAAIVGRKALSVPKGQLGEFAAAVLPLLRESVETKQEQLLAPRLEWAVVPQLTDPCAGKRYCR